MKSMARRISKTACQLIGVLLLLLLITAAAQAASVRGRLIRDAGNGRTVAVSYVKVTLYRAGVGNSAPVYSGADGMYYFYNVPPGDYLLAIWIYPGRQPLTYSIRVNEPNTDLAPIVLP